MYRISKHFLAAVLLIVGIVGCASTDRLAQRPDFQEPLKGAVYSGFSLTKDRLGGKGGRIHHGIDIPAPTGTPIHASAAGEVIAIETQRGYGKIVIIDHQNGWQTRYAHLSEFFIREGARVRSGATIGLVGATGNATGPHLHFEIRRNNEPLDPQQYLY
ncbi:MAG: M23 family metallopeptidase [Aquisalinus sp.]|nr:M23 family metallopeptidase [Aquisalinus sp.]